MKGYKYQDYIVDPISYKLRSGLWSPKAHIILVKGGTVTFSPVYSKRILTFKTKEEADKHALLLAKAWIDGRTSASGGGS